MWTIHANKTTESFLKWHSCPSYLWWVCACGSKIDLNAGKLPSSIFSLFQVSSFLLWLIWKSVRLDAVMNGVSSVFPEKSFWSRFWTALLVPCPNDLLINLMASSILGITTLSIAVKISLWTRLSMAATTICTSSFHTLSANFFSVTWIWFWLFHQALHARNC